MEILPELNIFKIAGQWTSSQVEWTQRRNSTVQNVVVLTSSNHHNNNTSKRQQTAELPDNICCHITTILPPTYDLHKKARATTPTVPLPLIPHNILVWAVARNTLVLCLKSISGWLLSHYYLPAAWVAKMLLLVPKLRRGNTQKMILWLWSYFGAYPPAAQAMWMNPYTTWWFT